MKHLILIRHAQARIGDYDQHDSQRRLSAKGEREACESARLLKQTVPQPDYIVCSDAVRTTATAMILAESLDIDRTCAVESNHALYAATTQQICRVIASFNDKYDCIALVGHNPSISAVTSRLSNDGQMYMMKTASAVRIDLPVMTWQDATSQQGKMTILVP